MAVRRLLLLLFLFFLGCIGQAQWTVHVIDDGISEYTIEDLKLMETSTILETVIETDIEKVEWEGVSAQEFGVGDIINFISEDGYMVSIPYDVEVILAFKKDGKSIGRDEGGPLKIAVDPYYGCKCNWLKYLRIVEFVNAENSLSVYGDVVTLLTFSPRDLNLYYGIEAVLNNMSAEVPLMFIVDKAICKENATKITFVTKEGRYSYSLSDIREKELVLVYDEGFHVYGLGITDLKGIKIE